MLGELLTQLLGEILGGILGADLHERHRRRRLARDHDQGRPLEFPGSVLGGARYCHPAGGLLRVDGASLEWLTGRGGMSFAVPVEQLDVRGLSDVRPSESFFGGPNVAVLCSDGEFTVRIVVLRSDLPFLALALPGVRQWLNTPTP